MDPFRRLLESRKVKCFYFQVNIFSTESNSNFNDSTGELLSELVTVYEQCIVPLLFVTVTLHSVLDCAVNSSLLAALLVQILF